MWDNYEIPLGRHARAALNDNTTGRGSHEEGAHHHARDDARAAPGQRSDSGTLGRVGRTEEETRVGTDTAGADPIFLHRDPTTEWMDEMAFEAMEPHAQWEYRLRPWDA